MHAYTATKNLFYTKIQNESIKKHRINQEMDTTVEVLLLSTTCIQHSIARNEYHKPYIKDNGASNIFKHIGQIFEEAEVQDKIG